MHTDEIISCIALTQIPGIGPVWAKSLIDTLGSAKAVFDNRDLLPEILPNILNRIVQLLDCPQAFHIAEKEFQFATRNNIYCIPITAPDYPSRLKECDDAPTILFYKGNAELNAEHIISVVGTRRITDYGKSVCINFINDLQRLCPDALVISGLAYGVDVQAHRSSMQCGLATVGVLAHGLDRIYPYIHRKVAVDMLNNGGLLTEFISGTSPERYNFISRNRIIAGLSDATVIVESADKGGSLITADIAGSYNRDCFAFPGRVNDAFSTGCNSLIASNKAALLRSAEDFVKMMGWIGKPQDHIVIQKRLFDDLREDQQLIVDLLSGGDLQINQLAVKTNLPVQRVNVLLFELEMLGIIRVLAGGMYQLL